MPAMVCECKCVRENAVLSRLAHVRLHVPVHVHVLDQKVNDVFRRGRFAHVV